MEVMNTRGYDRNIFTERELCRKVDYVRKNSSTRGLVETAEAWPWSSYRCYAMCDASILAMDWDGAWPILW